MKVTLKSEISGSRDGKAWPPPGTEVDLPDGEAASLIQGGYATPVGKADANVETAVALDPDTEARVRYSTVTRERAARSKRAHEPTNLGVADDRQPAEDDNGPRLPEVNAAESAKVEDPAQPTQSDAGPTGATKPVSEGKSSSRR